MIALDAAYPRHPLLWEKVAPELIPGELAHDASHIGRVYHWAGVIADELSVSRDLAGAAALVHDLVPIAKDHPDRALGGEQSAAASGPLLEAVGYGTEEIAAIIDAVATSSWSLGLAPNSDLGKVVQDADRLDAIGAIGIVRCIACAQDMSKPEKPGRFYHPEDPAALSDRPLDDRKQALDHFRAKLLTLAAGMHTETAKAEAHTCHQFMVSFIDQITQEALPISSDRE